MRAIGPKEQRHFDITYTFLADKSALDSALQLVQKISAIVVTAGLFDGVSGLLKLEFKH